MQDTIITICAMWISIALLPTVFSEHKPPRLTALQFTVLQTTFALTFATMDFWLSVAGNGFAAVLWFIILCQPRTKNNQHSFQNRVHPWMQACFGPAISSDKIERNHRFLEESLELVQATGCSKSEAYQLVDYVYGRPTGEKHQEIGGVMVTLAALCLAQDEDMHVAGEDELKRIWTKADKIRAKQAAKPKHSPLPE